MTELNVIAISGKMPVALRSSVRSAKPFFEASMGFRFWMGLPRSRISPLSLV